MPKKFAYSKMVTVNGKRYNIRADSPEELAAKVALKVKEVSEGKFIVSEAMTVEAWAKVWMENTKKPSISVSWYRSMESIIGQSILPVIGKFKVKDVRAIHCQKIMNLCSGKSPSYCVKLRNILSEMFEYARRNKLVLESPAEALNLPVTKKNGKRRPITTNERKHILKLAETHRAGTFIKFMLFCGLRPQEVAALQWCHIDLTKKTVTVCQALKGDNKIGETKSDSGNRVIPIPEHFAKELKKPANPLDFVCTMKNGNRHTATSIRQMWHTFKRELNLQMGCREFRGKLIPPYPVAEDLVLYCLRHTYGTDLQAAGVPINVARELMGHSSISITAEIYTHGSEEAFNSATKSIDELWAGRV